MKKAVPRKDMNPVERAILARERGIGKMRQNIQRIKQKAEDQIEVIEKRIAEKQFFLDALRKGSIKP